MIIHLRSWYSNVFAFRADRVWDFDFTEILQLLPQIFRLSAPIQRLSFTEPRKYLPGIEFLPWLYLDVIFLLILASERMETKDFNAFRDHFRTRDYHPSEFASDQTPAETVESVDDTGQDGNRTSVPLTPSKRKRSTSTAEPPEGVDVNPGGGEPNTNRLPEDSAQDIRGTVSELIPTVLLYLIDAVLFCQAASHREDRRESGNADVLLQEGQKTQQQQEQEQYLSLPLYQLCHSLNGVMHLCGSLPTGRNFLRSLTNHIFPLWRDLHSSARPGKDSSLAEFSTRVFGTGVACLYGLEILPTHLGVFPASHKAALPPPPKDLQQIRRPKSVLDEAQQDPRHAASKQKSKRRRGAGGSRAPAERNDTDEDEEEDADYDPRTFQERQQLLDLLYHVMPQLLPSGITESIGCGSADFVRSLHTLTTTTTTTLATTVGGEGNASSDARMVERALELAVNEDIPFPEAESSSSPSTAPDSPSVPSSASSPAATAEETATAMELEEPPAIPSSSSAAAEEDEEDEDYDSAAVALLVMDDIIAEDASETLEQLEAEEKEMAATAVSAEERPDPEDQKARLKVAEGLLKVGSRKWFL